MDARERVRLVLVGMGEFRQGVLMDDPVMVARDLRCLRTEITRAIVALEAEPTKVAEASAKSEVGP